MEGAAVAGDVEFVFGKVELPSMVGAGDSGVADGVEDDSGEIDVDLLEFSARVEAG